MATHRILFLCLGNICRSPMAEGIFRHLVEAKKLGGSFHIDSAGMGAWHTGDPPDDRGQQTLRKKGIDISGQRARQVCLDDFENFDLLVGMDRSNRETLLGLAPEKHTHKVRLLLEFAPGTGIEEVPDPYYGGANGFDKVFDLIDAGTQGLLASLDTFDC